MPWQQGTTALRSGFQFTHSQSTKYRHIHNGGEPVPQSGGDRSSLAMARRIATTSHAQQPRGGTWIHWWRRGGARFIVFCI